MGDSQNIEVRTYSVRWYLLCLLSLQACLYNASWAEWGPIAQSAKAVYGWTDATINMHVNYGNIGVIVMILPLSYLLDNKGIRSSLLISCFFTAIGTGLRCVSIYPSLATWFVSVGQFFIGLGGAVATVAPATFSETWFPHQERVTATSVSRLFNCVGGAVAFILGPYVVPEPERHCLSGNYSVDACNSSTMINLPTLENRITILNYIEFGWAVLLTLAVLFYFPNKPPHPPSLTAATKRTGFVAGFKGILRNKTFWHINLTYAIPLGVFGVWISTLGVILNHFGISQKEAGWLSFGGAIGGTICGLITSRLSDLFKKKLKEVVIILNILATASFAVFTMLCVKLIPESGVSFYFTCILGSSLINSAMPLYLEMACESTYPIAEGVTSGFVSLGQNLSGVIFLFVTLIPNIGYDWTNWALVGSIGITVPLLLTLKVKYNRLEIDLVVEKNKNVNMADELSIKKDYQCHM